MSNPGLFLLRKDPAIKSMIASVPILTGIGLAIRFAAGDKIRELAAPDWSGFAVFLFIVVWGVALFQVVGTGFWSRCNRTAMCLPIPARQLWCYRTLAVAIAVVFPVAGITLALGIGVDRSVLLLGGKTLAVLLLLLAVGQNPFPKLFRVPVSAAYIVFLLFLAFLALIYVVITPSTLVTILIPAGMAVLISVKTFLAVPQGFLTSPDLPGVSDGSAWWKWLEPTDLNESVSPPPVVEADTATDEQVPPAPDLTFRQVLHMTLFRTLINRFQVWVIGLATVFVSMALLYEFFSEQGNWVPLCYTPLWFLIHIRQSPKWIEPLVTLPIRRTLIFRYVAWSLLLPVTAGSLLGLLIVAAEKPALVNLENRQGINLQVPFEFWKTGRTGESPVVVSPWGEKLKLPEHILASGSRRMAYNPFAVEEESSDRFIAWQKARAIQTVYGLQRLPDSGDPQVQAGARSRLHNQTWGLGFLMLNLFLVAGLLFQLQQPRIKLGRFLVAAFLPTLGVLVGLVILAMIVGPAYAMTSKEAIDALPLILVGRLAGTIGLSGGVYLVLSILILTSGYFLVGRAFGRAEPDRTPEKTPWHDYRF